MILSDHSIREEIAAGRIEVDPYDSSMVQPSSIDVRLDRFFRVFLNHSFAVIDVKENLEELTKLVEISDEETPFILHPGEFVLGSTLERVSLPDDMVARIEGKSSLGRLGLLIHSSLPASEEVLVADGAGLRWMPIGDVVAKRLDAQVVGFDPTTFSVTYHDITGWYEGPADRIFEIRLGSGRSVRVTAGHNLFTLDRKGQIAKVRTGELQPGVKVAVPHRVPDPLASGSTIVVAPLLPESMAADLTCEGPTVRAAIDHDPASARDLLEHAGVTASHFVKHGRLPLAVARQIPGLLDAIGPADRIGVRGGRNAVPARIDVDGELAWFLGLYIAEGYRRARQVTVSNTDPAILDRAATVLDRLGLTYHRNAGAITVGSMVLSVLIEAIGAGGHAADKRVPALVLSWPRALISSFMSGVIDGDGCREATRTSIFTVSEALARDLLLVLSRLGVRAGSTTRVRGRSRHWQVYVSAQDHKLLTSIPLPDRLLVDVREATGLTQAAAARAAGYRNASDLNNIERRSGRDAVRATTLARLRDAYAAAGARSPELDRLVDGDLLWDEVVEVVDTGSVEPVYDLEVRPDGRKVENFLAGRGGVFVSNTAGFIDPGFDGHITLELSNVANLPITLYPGMKIGQISFHRMTTPADVPYGAKSLGSKYQGQRGPTPSRYWENFDR